MKSGKPARDIVMSLLPGAG
ncbi:hypothetical protein D030_1998A, partial [Vibrio parahaemolyticus AQ3810]